MRAWPLAAVVVLLAAGCATPRGPTSAPAGTAILAAGTVAWGHPLAVETQTLEATGPATLLPCMPAVCFATFAAECRVRACDFSLPECSPQTCADIPVDVVGAPVRLAAAVQPMHFTGAAVPSILDAAGKTVMDPVYGEYTSVVAADLAPGSYVVRVQASFGSDSYDVAVHVEPAVREERSSPAHDLLPDLVTLTPRDLQIAAPDSQFGPIDSAAGGAGCGPYEAVESQARRCLRFSNSVANRGAGPLEVRLPTQDEVTGAAGLANFQQTVHRSDGTTHVEAVGAATYHPTHGHYHYAGLAQYQVHHYDATAGEIGDVVAMGRKSGFCFLDSAIADLGAALPMPYYYGNATCTDLLYSPLVSVLYQDGQDPLPTEVMGISPGWLDYYDWFLDDQFVDMAGVADGTYALVSCANSERTLLESDLDNNCAALAFSLSGDAVAVLGPI